MPGTPAFSTRLAAPRYADSDPANFPSQVNAVLDRIDLTVAKDAPRVSVLPSSPADGDEVIFATTAMAALGVEWRLRYRAASSYLRKWDFVGGPEMYGRNVGAATLAAIGSWRDPGGVLDCQILVPLSGDYLISHAFMYNVTTTGSQPSTSVMHCGIAVAGAAPGQDHIRQVQIATAGIDNNYSETCNGFTLATLDAGYTYGQRYYRFLTSEGAGTTYSIDARRMSILPIRVG